MKYDAQILSRTRLFSGIRENQIEELLLRLKAREIRYRKHGFILMAGDEIHEFGILLSGSGRSCKMDSEGHIITITRLRAGSEIGVILAAGLHHKSPVSVEALEDSRVLMMSYDQLITCCSAGHGPWKQLLQNYMGILAEKGMVLHERIDCLLNPSLRGKIMAYLNLESRRQGSEAFTIPFDRAAMAEYLNVDRSALSRELSRMKQEQLIDFYKDHFQLKPTLLMNTIPSFAATVSSIKVSTKGASGPEYTQVPSAGTLQNDVGFIPKTPVTLEGDFKFSQGSITETFDTDSQGAAVNGLKGIHFSYKSSREGDERTVSLSAQPKTDQAFSENSTVTKKVTRDELIAMAKEIIDMKADTTGAH